MRQTSNTTICVDFFTGRSGRKIAYLFGSWRIAIAGYYGGQGSVLSAGVRRGMSWTQAAPRLNWIPAPGPNTKTMTMYAETSFRTARVFAKTHHLPPP